MLSIQPLEAQLPAREFRAAWIATVDNIDWPSERGLSVAGQKLELVALLDRAAELNLNAVILQVRPAADAMYFSNLEPWSEYLTGEMGQAPDPAYDPLAFAIEEAHRRALELHAWFNPFRAHHPSGTGPISPSHVSRTHPDLVRSYGEQLWLDPGEPDAVDLSLRVILDVVERYDLDGVHLDDYFYPYPIPDDRGGEQPFPDDQSWQKALAQGEMRSRNDWRRANVDRFVERLYSEVKAAKKWVKVGISPFGIWRPGHPDSVTGFDAYDRLFADARKWLREGWLDYVTPQLYWSIASTGQGYEALLDWWSAENIVERHLWPGNYASRTMARDGRKWQPDEIVEQVRATRLNPEATGNVFFSIKALLEFNGSLGAQLRELAYSSPALVPASPWLGDVPPAQPTAAVARVVGSGDAGRLELNFSGDGSTRRWAITFRRGGDEWLRVLPAQAGSFPIEAHAVFGMPQEAIVIAVNQTGIESQPVRLAIPSQVVD